MTGRRLAVACSVIAVLLTGTTACSMIGDRGMNEQTVHQANLANQRKAALRFISAHPNIEIIRFTHEGDRPGFGASWSANAVVTVDGKEYQEIPGLGVMGGDPLPSASPGAAPGPVTLIYSDGSSEVLP